MITFRPPIELTHYKAEATNHLAKPDKGSKGQLPILFTRLAV
jgi:hypothetical protein